LIFDSAGNLYGTNEAGGLYNYGTVFELSPSSGGGWTISVLYNFFGKGDGAYPVGGVVRDTAGNVYGTTFLGGGPNNSGIVFKLALVGGMWQESVLYRFGGAANGDGAGPNSPLLFNANKLFGTTSVGGDAACNNGIGCGTVFAIR
jgi:uncharacterized repeat protein (TIGR03803 family)